MALRETSVNAGTVRKCRFGKIVDGLDEEDLKILVDWVIVRNLSHDVIAAGLREDGHIVHGDSVRRHRNALCPCTDATDPIYGTRAQ